MQVRKFEAPTLQEALDKIKLELGPEAIILQTRQLGQFPKNLGILGKRPSGVEITAAVSERSLTKKNMTETHLSQIPAQAQLKQNLHKLPAERLAHFYEGYTQKMTRSTPAARSLPEKRYVEIDAHELDLPPMAPMPQDQVRMSKPALAASAAPKTGLEAELESLRQILQEMKAAAQSTPSRSIAPDPTLTPDFQPHTTAEAGGSVVSLPKRAAPGASPDLDAQNPSSYYQAQGYLQDVLEQLLLGGVDRKYALQLIRKTAFHFDEGRSSERVPPSDQILDALAEEVMRSVRVGARSDRTQQSCIALIGPTGVGKTTTLAKLASQASLRPGLRVGMINCDFSHQESFDQLATYAQILGLPFRCAQNKEDLAAVYADFAHLDVVLLDTAGYSPRSATETQQLAQALAGIPNLKVYLVLSATTRDQDLYEAAANLSELKPQGLILSKLDETRIYGGLYNATQRTQLPLLYFTTGRKIPDDIEEATPERVASLLLNL